MTELPVDDFPAWRAAARAMLRAARPPQSVYFISAQSGQPLLLLPADAPITAGVHGGAPAKVPAEFLDLAQTVACHREPDRWNWLYAALWRISHGEPRLLEDHADPRMRALRLLEKAVRRDMHKMRAFVRFRESADGTYVAWHKPEQRIVRANAPFFARRFGAMRWAILTPDESAYWDLQELRYGPGLPREAAPEEDQIEKLWLTYYASIFNPSRLNLVAMTAEMPVRHWSTLPETRVLADLIRNADSRVAAMASAQPASAKAFVPPPGAPLFEIAQAARGCEGCELHLHATRTVFGEGPADARIMLVGEQPGDQEDLAGKPFIGPAGELLRRAMADAGLDAEEVYLTNAVKHFHFERIGTGTQAPPLNPKHIDAGSVIRGVTDERIGTGTQAPPLDPKHLDAGSVIRGVTDERIGTGTQAPPLDPKHLDASSVAGEERGKRRIHKKPRGSHISACRPWLEAEIDAVKPRAVVCLGASAAQSLLGREVRVTQERGRWLENRWGLQMLVTIHPSALLRGNAQAGEYADFVADLKRVSPLR